MENALKKDASGVREGKMENRKWEVSIIELKSDKCKKFKVTRKISEMSLSETKIFSNKEEAKRQFDEWMEEGLSL